MYKLIFCIGLLAIEKEVIINALHPIKLEGKMKIARDTKFKMS